METLRIIHETNPQKYFQALYLLQAQGRIHLAGAHRYSIVKESMRSLLKERKPLGDCIRHLRDDLTLRAALPALAGETIVLAIAPWDWRLLIYAHLAQHNRVLYHTSWPDWRYAAVPRRYPPLDRLYRRLWLQFLNHPNVLPIVVQPQIATQLREHAGVDSWVIPHVVGQVFFDAAEVASPRVHQGLRLIYVGELSAKKGVHELIQLVARHVSADISLTVVGDGPLRRKIESTAARCSNISFRGSIASRQEMATLMAGHDVLALLSRRTRTWQELFGIVIIEALAAGLGVIATDHIGPRAIFSDNSRGNLFEEHDLAGIERLISRLARSRTARKEFIERQRGIADAYRIDDVAERWADVIYRTSNRPDRPALSTQSARRSAPDAAENIKPMGPDS